MANGRKEGARKEQIQRAAARVFARKKFIDATISDIAQEAGVSEATIYDYFSTKEELLFSVPRDIIQASREELETHLPYIRGAGNRLRSFIYHMLKFYQDNPDYASVALMILKTNEKYMETDTYQVLRELFQLVITIIEEGKESGEFRSETDPYLVRSVILGSIEHMVIRWLLLGQPSGEANTLVEQVDPLYDLIQAGILKEEFPRRFNIRVQVEPAGE